MKSNDIKIVAGCIGGFCIFMGLIFLILGVVFLFVSANVETIAEKGSLVINNRTVSIDDPDYETLIEDAKKLFGNLGRIFTPVGIVPFAGGFLVIIAGFKKANKKSGEIINQEDKKV
ncbi:MAG: hypothetical protein LBC82_00410 [Oscillospiraceae bacterium]|jgi:hypothetical protein|nr:hypothetical protein [Oscillospiraceae bacterium]